MAKATAVKICKCIPFQGEKPPYFYTDEDGFVTCAKCHGILNYMRILSECDVCGKPFKDPKRKYKKYAYTGPCCE